MKLKDLTGKTVGRLTVLRRDVERGSSVYWICRCECGGETSVASGNLGKSISSCGCFRRERITLMNVVHGNTDSPTWRSWSAMLTRCSNDRTTYYKNYGGRGIKVCERWKKFENFLEDMGERPEGTTLDRFPNNDGDYERGNCRWATTAQQACNRRASVNLTWRGETKHISDWSAITGLPLSTLYQRVRRGWAHEDVLSKPWMGRR